MLFALPLFAVNGVEPLSARIFALWSRDCSGGRRGLRGRDGARARVGVEWAFGLLGCCLASWWSRLLFRLPVILERDPTSARISTAGANQLAQPWAQAVCGSISCIEHLRWIFENGVVFTCRGKRGTACKRGWSVTIAVYFSSEQAPIIFLLFTIATGAHSQLIGAEYYSTRGAHIGRPAAGTCTPFDECGDEIHACPSWYGITLDWTGYNGSRVSQGDRLAAALYLRTGEMRTGGQGADHSRS